MEQNLDILRQEIVDKSLEAFREGLFSGTSGNMSCRVAPDEMLITPTSVRYDMLRAQDIVRMKLDGTVLEGVLQPSSEWRMHAAVYKAYGETVVLLSHKKADSYIHIDVEFGEGEGKIPVDSIAKRAEAYKPKEKVTYKMIKEYIEAKYGFKVHTAYIAEVKRNLGLPMYDAPNAVEELKQPRKHPTAEKVEAIKDALKHFEVI